MIIENLFLGGLAALWLGIVIAVISAIVGYWWTWGAEKAKDRLAESKSARREDG